MILCDLDLGANVKSQNQNTLLAEALEGSLREKQLMTLVVEDFRTLQNIMVFFRVRIRVLVCVRVR